MTVLSPIAGDYQGGKGRLYIEVAGTTRLEEVGDVDDFVITLENERLDRFSNQYGTRTKTDSRLLQQSASISFTAMQMTARNMATAMMSAKNFLTQTAETGSVTITGVVDGDIIDLEALDVSILSVVDGSAVPYVVTTMYTVDTASGLVKIIDEPTGGDGTAIVTFTKGSITADDKRLKIGGGSSPDLTAKLVFISLNANDVPQERVTIHSAKLAPNGDINMIADEYRSLPISGEIIADTTQAAGHTLYTLEDLVARTNTGKAD